MAEDDKTEFNSNVASLERVDILLRNCFIARASGDYNNWYHALSALRSSAWPKMTNGQKTECNEKLKPIQNMIWIYQDKRQNQLYVKDLYVKLDMFELWLQDFMDKKGMLLRDEAKVDETPDNW